MIDVVVGVVVVVVGVAKEAVIIQFVIVFQVIMDRLVCF
jgi:hypothetical protein